MIFWTKFAGQSKTKEHYHRIQHIQFSRSTKFHPKQTALIFWTKLAHKSFPAQNRKNEHHHQNCHIQVKLDPKLPLEQTILIF